MIVVDNDAAQSAKVVVDEFATKGMFVTYVCEPIRGLSRVRNRGLEASSAEYLAFIDDDEIANPDWLAGLIAVSRNYNADVVFGPVRSVLPDDAPTWAANHPLFNRPNMETGRPRDSGASGNVLLARHVYAEGRHKFDDAFAHSGGEDLDFFHRLALSGHSLRWAADAVVHEHVGSERLTPKWLALRSLRGGQSYVRVIVRRRPLHRRVYFLVKSVLGLMFGVVGIWAFVHPTPFLVRALSRGAAAIGHLSSLLTRWTFQEYAPGRYRLEER